MRDSIKPALAALQKLPRDCFLNIQIEPTEDKEGEILTAGLFQRAPEDGWPSRAARFGYPPGSPADSVSAQPYEREDRIIVAISVDPKDPETFIRLLNSMLREETKRAR